MHVDKISKPMGKNERVCFGGVNKGIFSLLQNVL